MKRALAIFAKTPEAGQVKTRLSPPLSPEASSELYRCMLLDTVARVGALKIDTYLFYDGDPAFFRSTLPELPVLPQVGEDLGLRMENAFTALSSLGYRSRTIIGTDAPDLPLSYIAQSFQLMESGSDVVFGPAEDGGYYLVAVSGGCGELFRDVPWSSRAVLEVSLERARTSSLHASLLPWWYDVDGYDDLYRPGLSDPANEAPLTRRFIRSEIAASRTAANAR